MKTNEEKKSINFDLSQFAKSAKDFAESNKNFKKENNVTSSGREQKIYSKLAIDAKRIERGKEVKESYSTEEQKPERKKLRDDLISKCKQIITLHENKSKNLNNWLNDFGIFYQNVYINHSFSWTDCLLNNASDEKKQLVQKSLDIFKDYLAKSK